MRSNQAEMPDPDQDTWAAEVIPLLNRGAHRLPLPMRDDVVQTVAERLAKKAARGEILTLSPALAATCARNAGIDLIRHEEAVKRVSKAAAPESATPVTAVGPEDAVVLRESYVEFVKLVTETLSEIELRVFWLKIEGLKSREIAEMIGKGDGGQVRHMVGQVVKKLNERMVQLGSTFLVEELLRAFHVHHPFG